MVGVDLSFEDLLSLDESGVFSGQVSGEFSPVSDLSIFGFLEDTSGFDELLSELGEELSNSGECFLVDVGGQFGKGSNDGLEESRVGLVFSESLLDGIEFGLDLSE